MVKGTVSEGFEAVRTVLQRHFDELGEVGASVCVIRDGELVVDLWGGVADRDTGTPWQADTLVNTFSVTKGAVAIAILRLEDRGELDLDAPVAAAWPAFAANGKERITLRLNKGVELTDLVLELGELFDGHGASCSDVLAARSTGT